ncbi:MAG: DNA primase [Maricaulaceae bacterium]
MRFSETLLDEIKTRLSASSVIGRYVKLTRRGREYVGLSPFNAEKTPSFYVNDQKRFYHCFSSGKSGDIITFLQEVEGLSFPEAVERLAQEAGVPLPAEDPHAAARAERVRGLMDWMELANRFFQAELSRTRGAEARRYLEGRGVTAQDWPRFDIGFAPDTRTALKDLLLDKGAKPSDLIEAGLVIAPEDGGAPYDRFRGRIMFAIRDPRGRVVGFGGRALAKQARAKYLNSPDGVLFHKGQLLYRYPDARKAAADPKTAHPNLIVVEGYMDAIALARAGFPTAVAALGTAMTEDQLELAWKAGPEPILCFDGDRAGRAAAHKAIDRALPLIKPEKSLRFAFLPDGLDPDDMIRERGAEAMAQALKSAEPLADVIWRREVDAAPLDTPERRAELKSRLRAIVQAITDPDLAQAYRDAVFERYDAEIRPARAPVARREGGRWPAGSAHTPGPSTDLKSLRAAPPRAPVEVRALCFALVTHPDWLDEVIETFEALPLASELDNLRNEIITKILGTRSVDMDGLVGHLDQKGLGSQWRDLNADAVVRAQAPTTVHGWLERARAARRLFQGDAGLRADAEAFARSASAEAERRLKASRADAAARPAWSPSEGEDTEDALARALDRFERVDGAKRARSR